MSAHTSIAAAHLARIVERFLDGRASDTVIATDGTAMPLIEYLDSLRFDRSEFSSHLASRMNMMASPALVSEVAQSLRDRLIEAAR